MEMSSARRNRQRGRTISRTGSRAAARPRPTASPRYARGRRGGRLTARQYEHGARSHLRRFRQGTIVAVALTALLLLVWNVPELEGQDVAPAGEPVAAQGKNGQADPVATDPVLALEEAAVTVRDLVLGFYGMLPKLVIAFVLIVLAALAAKITRAVLHRVLRGWEKTEAISALAGILLYLLAIGAALSVVAGDARALVGSVGLAGLALSWALQTPIESFTGWVLNAFRGYYRIGDRIEVGDVFGDVYKMDVLTTTVWEAGGPGKSVAGAQATGAMITFPNWEVLRSNIVNYSRDFPFVWDEVTLSIANESDLGYTIEVAERVAQRVIGRNMAEPADDYRRLLERARLAFDVQREPQAFLSAADAWTNCTVRYLVPVRERRRWSSDLLLALSIETAKPEHRGRIITAYPRTQVELHPGRLDAPFQSPRQE